MKLKTYEECLAWMEAVKAYRTAAPEGVHMAHNDRVITLRNVDPAVIITLYNYFTTLLLSPGVKYECKLESGQGGEFCSLIIQKHGFMSYKLPDSAYRFFYRKLAE